MSTFRDLTEEEDLVFGNIAITKDQGHRKPILDSLLEKELIVRTTDARGRSSYTVPLLIHKEWCEWCSKNHKEEK